MFPSIRLFPSNQFYDGLITDHESILSRGLPKYLHNLETFFRERMIFFDIQCSTEANDDKSKCNKEEVEFTLRLVELITAITS